jgi:hypothetical protein
VPAAGNDVEAQPNDEPRVVNLLSLVDPRRDAPGGGWSIVNGILVSSAAKRYEMTWAFQPPAEYDYKVTFTRISGIDAVDLTFGKNGERVGWAMGTMHNTMAWFHRGDEVPFHLENGKTYTAEIKVRNDGVEAYVDDKLIKTLKVNLAKGNASDPGSDSIGIATNVATIAIRSAVSDHLNTATNNHFKCRHYGEALIRFVGSAVSRRWELMDVESAQHGGSSGNPRTSATQLVATSHRC